MLTVALNLTHAHPGIGGGWQYISRLISSLCFIRDDIQFIAYTNRVSRDLFSSNDRVSVRETALSGANRPARVTWEHCVLPGLAKRDGVQVIHWFANTIALTNRLNSVVTVYDLLPFLNPYAYPFFRRSYVRYLLPRTVHRASCVAAMSETTAQALADTFGDRVGPIVVVPPLLPDCFRIYPAGDSAAARDRLSLPRKFFLYVAHWRPHKNHIRLLRAYAIARSHEARLWPLVLCGRPLQMESDILSEIRKLGLSDAVRCVSDIPEKEMPLLFNCAAALVFPSLYEGGGMPLVEALGCGCPVIASDIPTSREFGGDAVLLFNPLDEMDICRKLLACFSLPARAVHDRATYARGVEDYRAAGVAGRLELAYMTAAAANEKKCFTE